MTEDNTTQDETLDVAPTTPKSCSLCRHVEVCKIFEGMVGTEVAWNQRFDSLIKFRA